MSPDSSKFAQTHQRTYTALHTRTRAHERIQHNRPSACLAAGSKLRCERASGGRSYVTGAPMRGSDGSCCFEMCRIPPWRGLRGGGGWLCGSYVRLNRLSRTRVRPHRQAVKGPYILHTQPRLYGHFTSIRADVMGRRPPSVLRTHYPCLYSVLPKAIYFIAGQDSLTMLLAIRLHEALKRMTCPLPFSGGSSGVWHAFLSSRFLSFSTHPRLPLKNDTVSYTVEIIPWNRHCPPLLGEWRG